MDVQLSFVVFVFFLNAGVTSGTYTLDWKIEFSIQKFMFHENI